MLTNNDIKKIIIIATLIIFWPQISDFLNPKKKEKKKEEKDVEIDDISVPYPERPDCKHIIYEPMSMAGPHTGALLPKGFCYVGDSYFDDKPYGTGDKFADEQAEQYESTKKSEGVTANLDSIAIILNNTGDEEITTDIADSTEDSEVWENESVTYDDWFLPSKDELNAMYENLYLEGVGDFSLALGNRYSCSSEREDVGEPNSNVWALNFNNGTWSNYYKYIYSNVRPCRSFTDEIGVYSLRDTGPAGGLIFYIDGTTYYEAYTSNVGYTGWSNVYPDAIGTTGTAIGTGKQNTLDIIGQVGHITSAAKLCNDLSITN